MMPIECETEPGNIIFSLEDNPLCIYKLLCSIDYENSETFSYPRTSYDGQIVQIRGYKISTSEEQTKRKNRIYIPFEDGKFLMLIYDTIDNNGKISGTIDCISYLDSLVKALKRVNRRLFSNMTLDYASIEKMIEEDTLQYCYLSGKYLNLWYKERDFVRIMYYIADLEAYEPIDYKGKSIIEFFEAKKKTQTEDLINKIIECGYKKYSQYHRWVLNDIDETETCNSGYAITETADGNFYDELVKNFNAYEDHIPQKEEFEEYCKDKMTWSIISDYSNKLMAGLIVSIAGKIQTEEFIFVAKEFRRRGIAKDIHKHWISKSSKESVAQHVAWVNDMNTDSIGLHASLGFIQQETNKIVFTKGL